MRTKNHLVPTLLLMLGFSSCTPSLSGRLVMRNGDPVVSTDGSVNATRLEKSSSSNSVRVIALSDDGSFSAELQAGTYLIETFVPDYTIGSQRVTIGKSPVELRFVLEKIPMEKPRPIGTNFEVDAARGPGAASLTPPQL